MPAKPYVAIGHPCDSYEPVLNRQEWRVKSAQKQEWRPFPKSPKSLQALVQKAKHCKNCDLWRTATQTVFGAGHSRAKIMMIGEQPGHEEDLQGKPFVGPAGRLFDKLLREAGIDREKVYLTNAVKHFKWEPRGKRRIHKKPNAQEIAACRPWLDAEMAVVQPAVLVCLGATAAQALLGKTFRVTQHRGEFVESSLAPLMATLHPSAILRAPDEKERHEQEKRFVEDLKKIAKMRL
jgi:DNA polymerase